MRKFVNHFALGRLLLLGVFLFLWTTLQAQRVEMKIESGEVMYTLDKSAALNLIAKARDGQRYNKVLPYIDLLTREIDEINRLQSEYSVVVQKDLSRFRTELIKTNGQKNYLLNQVDNLHRDIKSLKIEKIGAYGIAILSLTLAIIK